MGIYCKIDVQPGIRATHTKQIAMDHLQNAIKIGTCTKCRTFVCYLSILELTILISHKIAIVLSLSKF